MRLWEQLNLDMDRHKVITLVGGGGKTSLMYALAHQARAQERTVIVTTSTHIMPHPGIFLTDDPDPAALAACVREHGIVTLGTMARTDKLTGVGEIEACRQAAQVVLIEGDGAKLRPLKAPAAHEPVIPPGTDAVVAVAGVDSVGRPIREICHRVDQVCALLGKSPEAPVEEEDVAHILSSPRGSRKGVGPHVAYRCVLNKADVNPDAARRIAGRLYWLGIQTAITSFDEEERGGLCWF